MKYLALITAALIVVIVQHCACARAKELAPPEMWQPAVYDVSEFRAKADVIRARIRGHSFNNWVARKDGQGGAHGLGDSLLFTGLAIASLPCAEGAPYLDAILGSMSARSGALVRYEPLGAKYIETHNETSRDQVLGAIIAFLARARRCGDSQRLAPYWRLHRSFVQASGWFLYPGTSALVTPTYGYSWDLVGWRLGVNHKPQEFGQRVFFDTAIRSDRWLLDRREACFPLHLTALQILVQHQTVGVPKVHMDNICKVFAAADIPLLDWMCGKDIRPWLTNYSFTREYAHQRCSYETPDLPADQTAPGVDWLFLLALAGGAL